MAEGTSSETRSALLPAAVRAVPTSDGGWRLGHRLPLDPYPPTVLHRLRHWAGAAPDHPALA
jgi:hypothetical protein